LNGLFEFYFSEQLLMKSCRFLVSDEDGNTPLHLMCQMGHYEGTELLLQHQIRFNKR